MMEHRIQKAKEVATALKTKRSWMGDVNERI